MRLLWHSNAPWCMTGYGLQTALFAPLLQAAGHEVAISAFFGLQGGPTTWNGLPVYPGSRDNWGLDCLPGHYRHWNADLCVTLMDTWKLDPPAFEGSGVRIAAWTPVDCSPLGCGDREALEETQAFPVAVSRFGERMLGEAGFEPLYVPHSVDTAVFQPPADREQLRRDMGLSGEFVIGINAANRDHSRKGFPEQFRAFAAFRKTCPEAMLLIHSARDGEAYGGLDLLDLADECGILGRVRFCQQYEYLAGMTTQDALAAWYGALDVLSCCSWGEGFGIPLIEAQACGTPVIVTHASAMTELRGPGWEVHGEPFWHPHHKAWWTKPSVPDIAWAYGKAAADAGRRRKQAREFALQYDAKRVLEEHWLPALARIASM